MTHTAELLARTTGVLPQNDALGISKGPLPPMLSPIKTSATAPPLSPSPRLTESPSTRENIPLPFTPLRTASTTRLTLGPIPDITSGAPLSPRPDQFGIFGSVPRRTRGLDFARACTNLHHTTIATESSPDSSPTITSRALFIPKRSSLISNMGMDIPGPIWATGERSAVSSSLGSISMLDSGDSSGDDSDLDDYDNTYDDDTMVITPQVNSYMQGGTPFNAGVSDTPRSTQTAFPSPAQASLMNFQRARMQGRRNSRSLLSSRRPEMGSPSPLSPPVKMFENGSNYFSKPTVDSRRNSLSWGTKTLHISSEGDSDESRRQTPDLGTPRTPKEDRTKVVRRVVAKRANMLPKPKNCARIRATLQAEKTPADVEVLHEAEVLQQIYPKVPLNWTESALTDEPASLSATSERPPLLRKHSSHDLELEDESMIGGSSSNTSERGYPEAFSEQVKRHSRGAEFWETFENQTRTPPASRPVSKIFTPASENVPFDSPVAGTPPTWLTHHPALAINERRHTAKRRRVDDELDFDVAKRRAVSPGLSAQNSPVLPQSPASKDGWYGPGGQVKRERESSGGSTSGARNSLLGMREVDGEGIGRMSIG
jgi:hypothetical protein